MILNNIIHFLTDQELLASAENFLGIYHQNNSIPVPIDEIVEHKLKIQIIPLPGLHQVAEVDGFITSNLKTIYIEEKLISADKPFRY